MNKAQFGVKMTFKYYKYPMPIKITRIYANIIGPCLPILYFLPLLLGSSVTYPSSIIERGMGFFFLLLASIGAILVGGYFPDIGVGEDGIKVEFWWFHLFVAWGDIISVQEFSMPMFGRHIWLVKSKRLTPLHRLYALGYGSFSPSFMIHQRIPNHNELLGEIHKGMKKRKP